MKMKLEMMESDPSRPLLVPYPFFIPYLLSYHYRSRNKRNLSHKRTPHQSEAVVA